MIKMSIQNLINELVGEYMHSRYDEIYLKEKIKGVLELILPKIAVLIKNRRETPAKLWDDIKEDEKIKHLFRKSLEKADRPIVIYVSSKFENNQYFGTRIIKEALRWK